MRRIHVGQPLRLREGDFPFLAMLVDLRNS